MALFAYSFKSIAQKNCADFPFRRTEYRKLKFESELVLSLVKPFYYDMSQVLLRFRLHLDERAQIMDHGSA